MERRRGMEIREQVAVTTATIHKPRRSMLPSGVLCAAVCQIGTGNSNFVVAQTPNPPPVCILQITGKPTRTLQFGTLRKNRLLVP